MKLKVQSKPKSKKKLNKKRKTGWIFIKAMVIFLFVYIGASFILNTGKSLTTVVVKNGFVEDVVECEGYIFKDS